MKRAVIGPSNHEPKSHTRARSCGPTGGRHGFRDAVRRARDSIAVGGWPLTGTYRPRVSRDLNDRLTDWASRIAGTDVDTHPEALRVLVAYLDLLDDGPDGCPDCGGELAASTNRRHAWKCVFCDVPEDYPHPHRQWPWRELLFREGDYMGRPVPVEPEPNDRDPSNPFHEDSGTTAGVTRQHDRF